MSCHVVHYNFNSVFSIFGRPFVKRFTICYCLCYPTIVLSVLSVTVCCGQTVGQIKMKLGVRVGLVPGHIMLDGDPAPPPQRDTAPQFSAHICCCQMAGWIKMPLGREAFLPSDNVLDGDPAPPPQKGGRAPNFWPMSIVAKRLDGSRYHLVWR